MGEYDDDTESTSKCKREVSSFVVSLGEAVRRVSKDRIVELGQDVGIGNIVALGEEEIEPGQGSSVVQLGESARGTNNNFLVHNVLVANNLAFDAAPT